jgi:hypothetical protein
MFVLAIAPAAGMKSYQYVLNNLLLLYYHSQYMTAAVQPPRSVNDVETMHTTPEIATDDRANVQHSDLISKVSLSESWPHL